MAPHSAGGNCKRLRKDNAVTCGIWQALVNRGLWVASFKCGPITLIRCSIQISSVPKAETRILFSLMNRCYEASFSRIQQILMWQSLKALWDTMTVCGKAARSRVGCLCDQLACCAGCKLQGHVHICIGCIERLSGVYWAFLYCRRYFQQHLTTDL
jgi:hypothetical protein